MRIGNADLIAPRKIHCDRSGDTAFPKILKGNRGVRVNCKKAREAV